MEFKPFLKVLYRIYSVYFKSNILVSNMRCFIHSYIHTRISICSVCVKRSLLCNTRAPVSLCRIWFKRQKTEMET